MVTDVKIVEKDVKKDNKSTWYYYYKYTDDGINFFTSNRYSTGIHVDKRNHRKSKKQAEKVAQHRAFKKEEERLDKQRNDNFGTYTQTWFLWNSCPYLSAARKRGREPSRSNADADRRILVNHILPTFENLKLSEITTAHIENWMFKLQEKSLCGRTINTYYKTLRKILSEATRLGDINFNPCVNVKLFAEKDEEIEILTRAEFKKLFLDDAWIHIWDREILYFTLTYLSASTGLRMGEIQGLRNENIDLEKLELKIFHGWDRKYGLKGTKTTKTRIVPITSDLAKYLKICQKFNSFGHIFSCSDGIQPVDHKAIGKYYKRAMEKIGIKKEEQKNRKLTFHAFRHFANTYFNDHLDQSDTMKVIGHTTREMNYHYDHPTAERLSRIRETMEKLAQ